MKKMFVAFCFNLEADFYGHGPISLEAAAIFRVAFFTI
jgi:hypothetical protein